MSEYVSRRPPRVRQAEALAKMRGQRVFALRMAQRVGKSKVLIDDFGYLYSIGEAQDILIVAPGGAYRTWPAHVQAEFPDDLLKVTRVLLWESSRAKLKPFIQRLEDFLEYREGPRVLVMNIEALSSVQGARTLAMQFLKQRASVCAIDESVVIKNADSACGKFVAENFAPLSKYRRILTGLIAPRSPLDIWNQFRFLNIRILGHATFATFKARYAVVKKICMLPDAQLRGMLRSAIDLGSATTPAVLQWRMLAVDPTLGKMPPSEMRRYLESVCDWLPRDKVIDALGRFNKRLQTIEVIQGYQNEAELAPKIEPYSYRCKLEDCYDLPPSDYSIREVSWHPEQKRVYDSLRKTAIAELESLDHVTATHVIVRLLRLHQILCGHVMDENGIIHDVPEKKTSALLSLLEDFDGKAIVWTSYRHSVALIVRELAKVYGAAAVAEFHGGNVKEREDEEKRFKNDARCRFLVATGAGRYGREWSIADLSVYYSCRNDLDFRSQSEERVKSVGKTRQVAYVDLVIPGTIDEKFLWAMREKIDMAAVIDNDSWRSWVV